MSHSPGPWTLEDYTEIHDANGKCVVWELGEGGLDWHEADARLIVAAPDLLHACDMALHDRMYKEWPEVAGVLIAAIEKATGEKLR